MIMRMIVTKTKHVAVPAQPELAVTLTPTIAGQMQTPECEPRPRRPRSRRACARAASALCLRCCASVAGRAPDSPRAGVRCGPRRPPPAPLPSRPTRPRAAQRMKISRGAERARQILKSLIKLQARAIRRYAQIVTRQTVRPPAPGCGLKFCTAAVTAGGRGSRARRGAARAARAPRPRPPPPLLVLDGFLAAARRGARPLPSLG